MSNTIETTRNVTLSFKTTSEEKTALQQIANEKQISRSELIASLVNAYKYHYDYIGKSSPKEEELKSKLKITEKENRKLTLSLENAEHRIEMEQRLSRKHVKEQLRINKTLFDLQEELKIAKSEISKQMETFNSNQPLEQTTYDSQLLYSSLGSLIISGLTLLFIPKLFNN
ncbi:hypothetical protein [Psychroserpens algicola]|uniref:Ribbon-helix-helix protein, copG family n=1 Tax=Psychroserpens algicola TaxID=1719034 RepID=A0ABT0HCU6_9FLAO|nr:hypothetical protein [Psychroserpens algicola]MCK8482196.1 hypothetical protein [Psychroserpens algicola]